MDIRSGLESPEVAAGLESAIPAGRSPRKMVRRAGTSKW